MDLSAKVKKKIRDIVDFPKPGIVFKDITPIMEDAALCKRIVTHMAEQYSQENPNALVGIESRGFFFGPSVAQELDIPFVPIRKKGKLPYKTVSYSYELEYGTAEIEMHEDAIQPNWKVVVHDDLLATGGTAEAAAKLLLQQGARVSAFGFLVELTFLNGNQRLKPICPKIVNIVDF